MNEMSYIYSVPVCAWDGNYLPAQQQDALRALEAGLVLFLPEIRGSLLQTERIEIPGSKMSL